MGATAPPAGEMNEMTQKKKKKDSFNLPSESKGTILRHLRHPITTSHELQHLPKIKT